MEAEDDGDRGERRGSQEYMQTAELVYRGHTISELPAFSSVAWKLRPLTARHLGS